MDGRIVDLRTKLEIYKAIAGPGGNLADCPVRDVIANISGKWNSLLMAALAEKMFGPLGHLLQWAERNHAAVRAARANFDATGL